MKTLVYLVTLLLVLVDFEARCTQLLEEKLDLNQQYKLLKKPAIKVIKTNYGDIYDCIDFYKQPAFNHPLLKNHTFHPQMRPSFIPKMTSSSQQRLRLNNIELNDGGCPEGTVPIRRINKNEFIKSRQFTEEYEARIKSNNFKGVPGDHFAIVETKSTPSAIYTGVGGAFSTHGDLPIKPSQYSSAGVIVRNGNDLIQVGWTINPSINNDNRTHFFQYFSAGTSHCFNTQCPGFVNLRSVPIDSVIEDISKRGDKFYVMPLIVYKDRKDGNWWLAIDHKGKKRDIVGFWPSQIFSTLADSASYVAVGGEAYGPLSERLPAMGNGYYPIYDFAFSAFCCHFVILDANFSYIDDPRNTRTFTDDSHYGVLDVRETTFYYDLGRLILYGGISRQE